MKVFLCLFVVSFAANQGAVFGHKGFHQFKTCCKANTEDQSENFAKFKELMAECRTELNISDDQHGHGQFACISECVGKKMNIVNSDGSLNEDEFRKHVNDMAKEDYKKAIADDTATECIEKAKAPSKGPPKDSNCSAVSLKAGMCVQKKFFKACPIDQQDPSEQCVEFRKKIESGHGQHGPPPPPPQEAE